MATGYNSNTPWTSLTGQISSTPTKTPPTSLRGPIMSPIGQMSSIPGQWNNISNSVNTSGSGQVLGVSTGDSGPDLSNPVKKDNWAREQGYDNYGAYQDYINQQNAAQNALNTGYDEYYRNLDAQMSGLDPQRSAQEQIANNTYNQGFNTVTNQYQQGQKELAGSREKTLRDLSNNLMQSWQQGNTYLGSRGASDSSAANQYAYALTKMGNQQRGDVQGQYDQNIMKLKTTYDTETKNLELAKNSQLQQIAQWFSEAQNALRSQRGQAALQKSQQALSMAMQAAQQVQQQVASQRAALDTWAANHAKTFNELRGQLAQNAQWSMSAPNNFGIGGATQQNYAPATGYGGLTTEKDMWGNPIRR